MIVRLVIVVALCLFSLAWSTWAAFDQPDATWARRWLERPWTEAPALIAIVFAMVIVYWPRRR